MLERRGLSISKSINSGHSRQRQSACATQACSEARRVTRDTSPFVLLTTIVRNSGRLYLAALSQLCVMGADRYTLGFELYDCECNRLWLLKNSFRSVIRVKTGDQKCLEVREDRLLGIVARSDFCRFGWIRVFQQPQAIALTIPQPSSLADLCWKRPIPCRVPHSIRRLD